MSAAAVPLSQLPPGIPGSCLAGDAGHQNAFMIIPLLYDSEEVTAAGHPRRLSQKELGQ